MCGLFIGLNGSYILPPNMNAAIPIKFVLSLLLTFLFGGLSMAQSRNNFEIKKELFHERFTINDGLPSNTIYSICQTSDGYLWLATNQGVSRYDGIQFQNFTTYNGLPDNEIFQIYEDSKHRLWFLSLNGKLGYYHDGKFHNSSNHPLLSQIHINSILLDIMEDDLGQIWICSEYGGIALIENDSTFSILNIEDAAYGFLRNNESEFVITENGIWKHLKDKSFEKIFTYQFNAPVPRFDIHSDRNSLYHRNLKLLIASNSSKIETKNIEVKSDQYPIAVNHIDNNVWLGTRFGVSRFDSSGIVSNHFPNMVISDIFKDREENYWFSTLNNGLIYVPDLQIKKWQFPKKDEPITNLNKVDDELWFSTLYNYYSCNQLECKQGNLPNQPNALISNIRHLNDGNTWVIAKPGITYKKNATEFIIPHYGNDFLIDDRGYYWLAAKNLFRGKQEDFKQFKLPIDEYKGVLKNWDKKLLDLIVLNGKSNCLMQKDNRVYIGTESGLYWWDYNLGQMIKYDADKSLSVIEIDQLDSTNILINSREKGLQILTENERYLQTSELQLPDFVHGTITRQTHLDQNKHLWISTNNGLYCLDSNLDIMDFKGVSLLKEIRSNCVLAYNNKLLVGANQGLVEILNYHQQDSIISPLIRLKQITLNGNQLNVDSIEFEQNSNAKLSLSFKSITIKSRHLIKYFYRINSKEWLELANPNLNLVGLQTGEYQIELKSQLQGKPSNIISIETTVQPSFWQRTTVRIIGALLLAGLIYLIIKFREKSLRKKHLAKQEIIEKTRENQQLKSELMLLEQEALRLQLNPHFVFNVLNTIKGYYAEDDFTNASKYMSLFSKLLRSFLESSKTSVTIETELNTLQLYIDLASIRFPKNITFLVEIDKKINTDELLIPSMLLQPFVENSIMHGLGNEKVVSPIISIRISEDSTKNLAIELKDNGIGINEGRKRPNFDEHKSKSISIIQKRLDLLGRQENKVYSIKIEDLSDVCDNEQGTRVTFNLPITIYET